MFLDTISKKFTFKGNWVILCASKNKNKKKSLNISFKKFIFKINLVILMFSDKKRRYIINQIWRVWELKRRGK
jgi:hypothetical protein